MLLELIVLLIIGIIFLIVGWFIWKREKINLIMTTIIRMWRRQIKKSILRLWEKVQS